MSNIIEITDLAAPELAVFSSLTNAELRRVREPEKGLFIAESAKVVGHALDAGCEPTALLLRREHINGKARGLVERCGVPVYTADDAVLETLTGFRLTRGVLCAMKRPPARGVEEVCAGARRIAVLEGVVDPTNVGAIFRSAAGLGADAVLVTPTCCDPLHRRAVRVSMGAVFQIPWARVGERAEDWPAGLSRLRSLGFKTAALALSDDSVSIDDPRPRSEERLALVLGSEGDGLSPQTVAACDYTVRIPMSRGVDSLNVAAASAVAFWETRYQDENQEKLGMRNEE